MPLLSLVLCNDVFQAHVYESDFMKERHDREHLVGQLEDAKEELQQTKNALKVMKHQVLYS